MKTAKSYAPTQNADLSTVGAKGPRTKLNTRPSSGSGKTKSRAMHPDKPQSFLLKGKKQRPETAKPKKVGDLSTNQLQDEAVDLKKIMTFYRSRVEAHEKDRFSYLQKMEMLRVKQENAHRTEWELKKRTEERYEMQRALQQCQESLGQERGTIEEMKDGGDMLKVK